MDLQEFNRTIIEEFRANRGMLGGQFKGAPMLLLTTTGAKSGLGRINPLAYLADGERFVIFASYAGAPTNPPWFYNLVANPDVVVEVGSERFGARADLVAEPERTTLYRKMAAAMPAFSDYESKTTRAIPVIALRRK